jgi:hypothetical protein
LLKLTTHILSGKIEIGFLKTNMDFYFRAPFPGTAGTQSWFINVLPGTRALPLLQ